MAKNDDKEKKGFIAEFKELAVAFIYQQFTYVTIQKPRHALPAV